MKILTTKYNILIIFILKKQNIYILKKYKYIVKIVITINDNYMLNILIKIMI